MHPNACLRQPKGWQVVQQIKAIAYSARQAGKAHRKAPCAPGMLLWKLGRIWHVCYTSKGCNERHGA